MTAGQGTGSPGVGHLRAVVLNAQDPPGLAAFYAQVLGDEVVDASEEWAELAGSGVAFQLDPVTKEGANRLHLDVRVEDLPAATETVLGWGATTLSEVRGETGGPWRVFADPEGNEFCLVTA